MAYDYSLDDPIITGIHGTLTLSEYVYKNVLFVKSDSKCVAVRDTAPMLPFQLLHSVAYYVKVSQERYENEDNDLYTANPPTCSSEFYDSKERKMK
jgi:hypothetical protein